MARPTTKAELLDQANAEYDRLMALVDGLDLEQLSAEFPFEDRDRRLRDVIGHVREWQEMAFGWYEVGMSGGMPQVPAPGHTWQTTARLNAEIWSGLQDHCLESERERLAVTHARMLEIIEGHTDAELFTKKRYPWTKSTSVGAYLISATSSHYVWAHTKLRKAVRGWAAADSAEAARGAAAGND